MRAVEWLNHNQYRSYPFVEDQVLQGADGGDVLDLPLDTLLDLTVLTHTTTVEPVLLEGVDVDGAGTTVTFIFTIAGVPTPIVVSTAITAPFEGEVRSDVVPGYAGLLLRPVFGAGVAKIGSNLANHGKSFVFNLLLEPSTTISATNPWVTKVTAIEPGGGETDFFGDVLLAEGYNVILDINRSRNTIEIKAAVGAGQGEPCEPMLDAPADCDESIYYINGRHPDWFGRFTLDAGPGLKVTAEPGSNKLVLTTNIDPCRPKCKDPECP
jgi:hypothetical protein